MRSTLLNKSAAGGGCAALAVAAMLGGASTAHARPTAPPIVCDTFPDTAICAGKVATCDTCHTATWPAAWNPFGLAVAGALKGPFEENLAAALVSLQNADSDGDGISNVDELRLATNPGDAEDKWSLCTLDAQHKDGLPVAPDHDFTRVFKRVSILYCGASPSYEQLKAFTALPSDAERYGAVHKQLDICLTSDWWRDEGLPRLADWRIRPLASVGKDSPAGIIIGDYEWDYRLFSWAMTGGRDVRDLLLATYHVDRAADGQLQKVEGPLNYFPGQPLPPERRAGMITTQWFFAINTMFSPLPRTSAAQAYRAYLGNDMAKQEGVWPIAAEPLDIDNKGVKEEACAGCHSTLDPLSYAFAFYYGIAGQYTGQYSEDRPAMVIPGWSDPQTVLFGQPVDGVTGWAEVAADSDAFKRTVVLMLFKHAIDRPPLPDEQAAFASIWRALPEAGWSADAMVHRLVDTYSFGVR